VVLLAENWSVPPVRVIVPVEPRASAEPRASVPPARVVPPVKVFVPESVSVPAADLRSRPVPVRSPESVWAEAELMWSSPSLAIAWA
jgi:hypothetical protein